MDELRAWLAALAEPEYAAFMGKLLPGVSGILGVRMGHLRKMARQLARSNWQALEARWNHACYEEAMLHGLVLALAPMDFVRHAALLSDFAGGIHNWAVCDSVAASCKFAARDPEAAFSWTSRLASGPGEFSARFGLVVMLDHLLASREWARRCLEQARACPPGRYYTDMARAWLAAEACLRYPQAAQPLLAGPGWDPFTRRAAALKIRQSLRCTPALAEWTRSPDFA